MDLNYLMIFRKVAETGSFSKAALALNLPKSSISQKVTQIEQDLGVRLLHRTTRKVSLTEVGERIYETTTRIASDTEDIKAIIQNTRQEPNGLLRVTAPLDLGVHIMEYHLQGFLERYPKISVEFDLTNRIVDLVSEGYDLALRATTGPLRETSLIGRHLAKSRIRLYASPAWVARHGLPQVPDDLRTCPVAAILLGPRRTALVWRLTRGDEDVEIPVQATLRCNDFYALTRGVLSGLGVALLPAIICRPLVERGELVQVLNDWGLRDGDYLALYPSRRFLPAKTSVFLDYMRAALEATSSLPPK